MSTEKHKATAKEYFDSNPSEDVVHISTDGQVFFQKNYNDAVNHQRRIDEKEKLASVYRRDLSPPNDNEDNETPTDKWTNKEITEWLNETGVETTGKETKAELLVLVSKVEDREEE